jgi:hypothetical protein
MRKVALAVALSLAASACGTSMQATPMPKGREDGPVVTLTNDTTLPEDLAVYRQAPNGDWRPVCKAPCEERLDPRDPIRVGGPHGGLSPILRLPNADRVTLDVVPGSSKMGPISLLVFGGALLLGGGAYAMATNMNRPDTGGASWALIVSGSIVGALFAGFGGYLLDGTEARVRRE